MLPPRALLPWSRPLDWRWRTGPDAAWPECGHAGWRRNNGELLAAEMHSRCHGKRWAACWTLRAQSAMHRCFLHPMADQRKLLCTPHANANSKDFPAHTSTQFLGFASDARLGSRRALVASRPSLTAGETWLQTRARGHSQRKLPRKQMLHVTCCACRTRCGARCGRRCRATAAASRRSSTTCGEHAGLRLGPPPTSAPPATCPPPCAHAHPCTMRLRARPSSRQLQPVACHAGLAPCRSQRSCWAHAPP